MPSFTYLARDANGTAHRGTRLAETEAELANLLRDAGLLPTRIARARTASFGRGLVPSLGPRQIEIEMQLRQLAFMLRSGLSLLEALRLCAGPSESRASRRIWQRVSDAIRGGSSMHEAMSAERCFDRLTRSLVDVGERSGNLDLVLQRAAEALQRRRQTRTRVLTALAYPALVILLAIATVAFLVVGVIPKLTSFLRALGRSLPPSTQLLVDLSDGVQRHATTLVGGLCALLIGLFVAWHTRLGRLALESVLLATPLIGRILRLATVSAFAHAGALLLASGIRLTAALAVVHPLLPSRKLAGRLSRARERVVQGSALADALERERCLTPLVHGMVRVGESSGELDDVLAGVATHHDEALREIVQRLGTIIEPVILIVIGAIVGFVYFAFFMAIYAATGAR